MKKNKGMTLVELLATILIIGIVAGITILISLTVIKNARKNSYKVTINEVESNANNYVTENADRMEFVSDPDNKDIEYQCVSVQNLIDYGYLNKNVVNSAVSETENVNPENFVYIERDINSKAITRKEYLTNSSNANYIKKCGGVIFGNIRFTSEPSLNEYSRYKIITIEYMISNVNDVSRMDKYTYTYTFDGSDEQISGDEHSQKRVVKITSNGTLTASINYLDQEIESDSITIDTIDSIGPVIALANDSTQTVKGTVTIPLIVTDVGVGVDENSFTKEDISVTIGGKKITDFSLTNNKNGNYDLKITDYNNTGKVIITIGENTVFDKLENGNKKTELKTNITFDNTYNLYYNGNGQTSGSTANSICIYNTDCQLRTNGFSKTGYTFDGWYTEASGGTKLGATIKITKDTTVYAHWKSNDYTITYNGNGATGGFTAATTCKYNVDCPLQNNGYSKTGYTFDGWYSAASGGSKYDSTTKITNNITVYAHWKLNTYTITYNGNGATGGSTAATTCSHGASCTIAQNGFVKTGHTFDSWYTEASGGTKLGTTTSITSNTTVYAHWKINSYTITYNGNGATSGSTAATTCNYNEDCPLRGNGFTKSGYTFDGWYTAASGGNKITSTKLTSNTTVYAHWKQNIQTVTITYDSNGGNNCNPKTKNVTYGSTYGSLCTPTKDKAKFQSTTIASYTFVGWSTTKEASKILTATDYNPDISPFVAAMFPPIQIYNGKWTDLITSSSKVTINKNHTLYAVWKTNTSFPTGGGGGGSGCPSGYPNDFGSYCGNSGGVYCVKGECK